MIPMPVIGLASRLLAEYYTHSEIENFFYSAGTTVPKPEGNKMLKAQSWLIAINEQEQSKSIEILGKVLQDFFGGNFVPSAARERMNATLGKNGLRYISGGTIVSALSGGATVTLESLIKDKKFPAVLEEFDRATKNVEAEPREAISAAANILEAVCKEYIVQHKLTMPTKQDLMSLFNVVRKDLGLDPGVIEDADMRKILSGVVSVADGVASLRTHASSAHAQSTSERRYDLTPRHARLAIHASHTLVTFVLETWESEKH